MRPTRPAAALAVIVALGAALRANSGLYSPWAVTFLCVALVAALAFSFSRPGRSRDWLLLSAIVVACAEGLTTRPYNDAAARSVADWAPHLGLYLASLMAALLSLRYRRAFWLAALAFAAMSASVIRHSPNPRVDVFVYQRDACAALLQARNPYTLTFPNPYSEEESWVFAPGTTEDGRILFGFPYFPLALLAVLPGHLLGDYRIAHAGFLLLTSVSLHALGRNRAATLTAILFLTTPRLPFAVEWGWTEPVMCALLLAALLALDRWPRAKILLAATFLLSKQYLLLLLPLAKLTNPTRRTIAWILPPLAVTAGFALWNWPAFYASTIALQFKQPFRPDALSLPALAYAWTGREAPSLLGPLAGLAVAAACAFLHRNLPDRPLAFARGTALSLLAFFALSKQAFANYYLLVIAAWCALLVLECRNATSSSSGPASAGSSPRVT